MNQKRVTIVEIAKEAGVSAQTVSRVVNGHDNVAEETRGTVQEIIDRLGYHPSRLARSLLRGHSNTLGVVTYRLGLYGPAQSLDGIIREAAEQGFSVLPMVFNKADAESPTDLIGRLMEYHVDGLIWAVPQVGDNRSWLAAVRERFDIPIVFMTMASRPGLSIVAVDNRLGGVLATEHLIARGNRTIGLVNGPADWWESQQRERGWREALQAAELPINEALIRNGEWTAASGEAQMAQLLQEHPLLEAVFVGNDSMAMGAFKAARAAGRMVPDDLGIVGFDDVPEAAYSYPALTTVRQDLAVLGRHAVNQLSTLIRSPDDSAPPQRILLEPELIVRESA